MSTKYGASLPETAVRTIFSGVFFASCSSSSEMYLFSSICVSTRSRACAPRSGCRSADE